MSLWSKIGLFLRRYLLYCLLGCYAISYLYPALGVHIKETKLMGLSGSSVLLGILLSIAGFGIRPANLRHLLIEGKVLLVGILVNGFLPILGLSLMVALGSLWHNSSEMQTILFGLAIVGTMPVAGSSVTWAQNSDGNMIASVGLVLLSTALSPFLSPLGLHLASQFVASSPAIEIHLDTANTVLFLAKVILIPTLIGLSLRAVFGEHLALKAIPKMKAISLVTLLLLNYVNGAVALPSALNNPDWDFLALTAVLSAILCAGGFFAGWLLAKIAKSSQRDSVSLIFALGMNNSGAGLVFASIQFAQNPLIMLPIILYKIEQHLFAGVITTFYFNRGRPGGEKR